MFSSALNRASRSPRARHLVAGFPATRGVVDRFIAGDDVESAVTATRAQVEAGRRVTIDVLGEDVTHWREARATADMYLKLLDALAAADISEGTDISIKLSALGQTLGDGDTVAADLAMELCAAAAAISVTVTLDMEDHTTVDSTLAIGELLRGEYPSTGNVLQANLHRTPGDIRLLAHSGVRIRFVKGAYREPTSVAHQRKTDIDVAYGSGIESLMTADCYPMIATHDASMLRHAAHAATTARRAASSWETQMLLGVRGDLQSQQIAAGRQLRVYVPFGGDWYGYFMRRLAERPANLVFFTRAVLNR